MPVARDTTSAISSAPTWVRSSCALAAFVSAFSAFFSCASSCGSLPYWISDSFCQSPLRLASSICRRQLLDLFLDVLAARTCAFSAFQISSRSEYSFSSRLISSSISEKRFCEDSSFSFFTASRSMRQLDQAPVEPVHRLGLGVDLHLDARRRLVDQVDRLVGQEAVGDVAVRELGRGDDRRVGDLDAVVHLVALLQAAQDRDGRLDGRLVDQHLLEAALERGVLLDVLAVLVQRGGADAVQLAARERGLEHVAGVDRALGLAGADHGVQLVDEDDGAALVLRELLQHRLQALLELAAVLGAREQRGHVEHQHALVLRASRAPRR